MAFRVGQKVVCVDAAASSYRAGCRWGKTEAPVKGAVYTVTRCFRSKGEEVVWLAEISRDEISRAMIGNDAGYHANRFRPVVERKTDISIFEKMLTGGKQPARV